MVAYLCKRGWEGFYVTNPRPGVFVSSQFNQLVNGDWYAWDVPIPSTDGTYNCVADAGDGRTISWTCIVSGGTYDVPGSHAYNSPASSGFTTTGNIGSGLTFFPSISYTPGGPAGTHPDPYVSSNPSTYPNSYPNNFRPAYFGIGFWYRAGGAGGNYVLTVTQIDPPIAPPAPAPVAQVAPTTSTGYTPANVPLDYLKFLFQQAGCNPENLTEDDLTVKYWRTLPSMDAIKNDIRNYAVGYSTGSGSQAQKDFCQPPSTGPAAAPAYMPSQTVNTNIKRKTKTCATCPSAPLLGSLPTPSIAYNVNIPHYCQRVLDDGGL